MLDLALLALLGPLDDGVRLDAPPRPGTVVTKPVEIEGEAQALEGVLRIDLYVVRGTTVTLVDSYEPVLPVGPVPFELAWDPKGAKPGRVTIRVVATTLARGLSAEAPGLVVPSPPTIPRARPPAVRAEPPPAPSVPPVRAAKPRVPAIDDSGQAFGKAAPVLPYARSGTPPAPTRPVVPVTIAAPQPMPPERRGWVSMAGGLLVLLVCSHLHRVLRTQPDPRDGR